MPFLPPKGCLVALALLLATMFGLAWTIREAFRQECTELVLDRPVSPDGVHAAVATESTCDIGGSAMTVVTVGVELVTTKPPIRNVFLLGVDTRGHDDLRPVVILSRPDVLQITVPLLSFLTVEHRVVDGVRVDLRFDPDDPPARAAWLIRMRQPPDPPENRPGL